MTRDEKTGKRNLDFSGWQREKLRDSSTGLIATDIDMYYEDYNTNVCMMIEVKLNRTNDKKYPSVRYAQRRQLKNLNAYVKYGAATFGRDFKGLFVIELSSTSPTNSDIIKISDVMRDKIAKQISEKQLIKFLNFEIEFQEL